jgi:hypothetical protein
MAASLDHFILRSFLQAWHLKSHVLTSDALGRGNECPEQHKVWKIFHISSSFIESFVPSFPRVMS